MAHRTHKPAFCSSSLAAYRAGAPALFKKLHTNYTWIIIVWTRPAHNRLFPGSRRTRPASICSVGTWASQSQLGRISIVIASSILLESSFFYSTQTLKKQTNKKICYKYQRFSLCFNQFSWMFFFFFLWSWITVLPNMKATCALENLLSLASIFSPSFSATLPLPSTHQTSWQSCPPPPLS